MRYRRDRSGRLLSALGFGCMRFPQDIKKCEELVCAACEAGVNYFDTAYMYGRNEAVLGAILDKFRLRERVFIATKLPIAFCGGPGDFDRFFAKELERLRTGYIDYYLMHMITDLGFWEKLRGWGIEAWIRDKKDRGEIRDIGFSFHGTREEFLKVLDAYDWDFCQIQYNYYDENYQAGVTGLRRAAEKGIPVIIMEGLLGGRLSSGLPGAAAALFNEVHPRWSPSEWGLRWLWDQEEVTVVLSGMTELRQLAENVRTAEAAQCGHLGPEEKAVFARVRSLLSGAFRIPCTGCSYCMPCPSHVNIPGCFAAYNLSFTMGFVTGLKHYVMSAGLTSDQTSRASLCTGCGRCERHCPQKLSVAGSLKLVRRRFEPFWIRWGIGAFRLFLGRAGKKS